MINVSSFVFILKIEWFLDQIEGVIFVIFNIVNNSGILYGCPGSAVDVHPGHFFVIFYIDSRKISTFSGYKIQGIICPDFLYCYFYSMKDFLVLGRCTAMGYKGINDCILEGKIWFGCTETGKMIGGDVHCYWFSNLVSDKKVEFIPLTRKYNEGDYRKMDFYDAINTEKVEDIPDCDLVIGVPVSFIDKWDYRQFDIVDARNYRKDGMFNDMKVQLLCEAVANYLR